MCARGCSNHIVAMLSVSSYGPNYADRFRRAAGDRAQSYYAAEVACHCRRSDQITGVPRTPSTSFKPVKNDERDQELVEPLIRTKRCLGFD